MEEAANTGEVEEVATVGVEVVVTEVEEEAEQAEEGRRAVMPEPVPSALHLS